MKKFLLFLVISVLFSSCTAVKFEEPQPIAAPSLSEFPPKMNGFFVSNDGDTLHIQKHSFKYSSGPEVDFEAKLPSSNAVLKKVKRYYILNIEDEKGWDVFPLKVARQKIKVHYAILDDRSEQLILDLRQSPSSVKEKWTEDGKFDHYLIRPTDKQFRRLLRKNLFSEKIVFSKLQ
ncbi:hypothetical protein [Salinimicrobium xinjiangense]|uniref:hypothetical protein n=1 Tax=Salinimicrobium xinjiangense TaxID=438596 RepID=UPI0004026B6F|nr:hypothetical protein [Salinimicrobium xinjiangense]